MSRKKIRIINNTNLNSDVGIENNRIFKPLNGSQELALQAYNNNDITFLLGSPGSGKTHCATFFAVKEILDGKKEHIVITRPMVEAGERLGFLPGSASEKFDPYMAPFNDCITTIVGKESVRDRDFVKRSIKSIPLALMRGITVNNSVFILDEAQNCSYSQIKMAITRLGRNSKMIITGDPEQSDLNISPTDLEIIVERISTIDGIGIVTFKDSSIVRHHLLEKILRKI